MKSSKGYKFSFLILIVGHIFLIDLSVSNSIIAEEVKKEEQIPENLASKITAKLLEDRKSIQIDWEAPKDEGEIIIARSNAIIDTWEKLAVADSLGKYPSSPDKKKESLTSYLDANLRSGKYYYCVIMVKDVKKRKIKLLLNQNSTSEAIIINRTNDQPEGNDHVPNKKDKNPNHFVTNINAILINDGIRLKWTPPPDADNSFPTYNIYKSKEPNFTKETISKAEKIVEINHPDETYIDRNLDKSQTVYYGISINSGSEEHFPLTEGQSYLKVFYIYDPSAPKDDKKNSLEIIKDKKDKKEKDGEKKEATLENNDLDNEKLPEKSSQNGDETISGTPGYPLYNTLNDLLQETYFKGKYRSAIRQLTELIQNEVNHVETIGKAQLYIAISHIQLGNYNKALRYLLKEETRLYSEKRTKFWLQKCLGYMGRRHE